MNNIREIIGKWPGTDAEFNETMREIEKEREMCEETECVHLYGLAKECIGKHRNDFEPVNVTWPVIRDRDSDREPIENVVYLSEVAHLSERDGFHRFAYCPRCGIKIDWEQLVRDHQLAYSQEDDE